MPIIPNHFFGIKSISAEPFNALRAIAIVRSFQVIGLDLLTGQKNQLSSGVQTDWTTRKAFKLIVITTINFRITNSTDMHATNYSQQLTFKIIKMASELKFTESKNAVNYC